MRCYATLFAFLVSLLLLAPAPRAQVADPALIGGDPFITVWKTDNPGASQDDQITIPTSGSGYNYEVNWGDGTTDTAVTGNITHTYANPGQYVVQITGDFPRISFFGAGDPQKILSVEQWGDIEWVSMEHAFRNATRLEVNATDAPDLSGVTSLQAMFQGAALFTGMQTDMNGWDVSSITNMSNTFFDASAFNGDISDWDVGNVHSMTAMFAEASAFNQPIGAWDVSGVNIMQGMFSDATSFNQDIGGWDVSNVHNMNSMFSRATAFNEDISGWDMSSVTQASGMFFEASAFNQDISGWDVSNVSTMFGMFWSAGAFDQDIGGWNVSNVSNMVNLFRQATAFNQDIGSWDVSNVTSMAWMFFNASAFNQELSWDIGNVTDMSNMLNGSGLSAANYDATLIGWAGQSVQSGVELGALNLEWCAGEEARHQLINTHGWVITGDAAASDCLPSDPANVAGWRMLSVPGGGLTVQDLADRNLVQGISDSYPGHDTNLYLGYDGPTNSDYVAAGSTGDGLDPGRGFFWYLFDDTDFGSFVPPEFVDVDIFAFPSSLGAELAGNGIVAFPAIPQTSGTELPAYMIGNPFQDPFQLAGVSASDGTLQTNFFAWDPDGQPASYVTLGASDYVTPWQGFWAEIDGGQNAPTFTLDFGGVDPTQDPPFIGLRSSDSFGIDLELQGTDENDNVIGDLSGRIRFEPDATPAWDRHDGSKFYPPFATGSYALLSLEGIRKGDSYRQAVRSLPSSLDEVTTIPLSLLTTEGGTFTLSADAVNTSATPALSAAERLSAGLPEGWGAVLHDLTAGEEADLLTTNYTFSSGPGEDWQDRFEITITPAGVSGTEGGPIELHVSNPSPNPASASTSLSLRLPDAQNVTARVYDALGRLVTIAHNGRIDAGEETLLTIDTSSLAAGAYVVRVEGQAPGSGTGTGFAETRRFTVVR